MIVDIAAAIAIVTAPGMTATEVASTVVGRPVAVACDSHFNGHVMWHLRDGRWVPEDKLHLSPTLCFKLERLRMEGAGEYQVEAAGLAIHVLAHEIAHVSGIMDEFAADCQAVRWHERVVTLLGGWGRRWTDLVRQAFDAYKMGPYSDRGRC